ncbi:MAG: LysM peptidoglycan-binding domain-containing protein [Desulfotignum sp.]|nr:LysM peptidoglycan-binding domain-containing protein [Desulfotignum sp.]
MHYIKLAATAFIIWLTFTGCQQAYQTSVTPEQGTDAQKSSQSPANQNPAPAASSQLSKDEPERYSDDSMPSQKQVPTGTTVTSLLSSTPIMQTISPETDSLTETQEEDESSQTTALEQVKIDQALELCNLAQEMWEAGNLEQALLHLDDAYSFILEIDTDQSSDFNQQKEDIRFLISKRILEIYASRQVVVPGSHDEIPITVNDHVKKEIERLTGPEKNFFISSLERAGRYRPYIVAQLKEAGLPEELSWLPLIESGYKLRALSSARALGLWQFIPSTGHKFGLVRNQYIDERMDPEKSTRAAIAYLKELHNLFGDWTTVLAAYNCGEGRVLSIIRNQRINYLDNFWDLYQNLPRETARYVPRFLATLHIIQNLDTYNITVSDPQYPVPYKTFEISKQLRIKDIAREIAVNPDELRALNPELRYDLLPPETYQLKIPENKSEQFLACVDKLEATYSAPQLLVYHKIRRGETLSSIANRYRTSVEAIARANNIHRTHRIIAGKVIKIPGSGSSGSQTAAARTDSKSRKPVQYKVQKGDSLWVIARKFSTTTKQIMAGNQLKTTTLYAGQTLTITPFQQSSAGTAGIYRVKSGDNPFLIAKKHNMSLNRLLALNHLSKKSKIFPGQKLIVE